MLRIGQPLLIALREGRILLLIGIARFGGELLGSHGRKRRESEQQREAQCSETGETDVDHEKLLRKYGGGRTEYGVGSTR